MYKDLEEFYYLLENNKLKEAEEFISNSLLSKPDDLLLLNNYGTVLLLKNDFSNANHVEVCSIFNIDNCYSNFF